MRNYLTLLIILFFCSRAAAQTDTIPNPPGLTVPVLKKKSLLRVSPDNHIWVAFLNIGLGEYNGSTWTMYDDSHALLSNNVTSMAFDGAIRWIGTDSGMTKTDGLNLITFHTLNSPLPSNNILSLYVGDTSLWIGTDRGVVSAGAHYWHTFDRSNSPIVSDTVIAISSNAYGIYFSTNNGVSIMTSSGWTTTSATTPVKRFTSDMNGNLYWKNYQIHDSVFHKMRIQSDPCFYNSLSEQPVFFLGATGTNDMYAAATHDLILDFDQNMHAYKSLVTQDPLLSDIDFQHDSVQLYDFNSLGELVTTRNNDIVISKTNLAAMNVMIHPNDCPYLDVNQVQARINTNGNNFLDNNNALYEVPKGSGKSPLFAEGLWISGRDQQGNLRVAAQTYRQSGDDFWPGPLDTTNASTDLVKVNQYDRLFKVDRFTINQFMEKYLDGSVANGTYAIPDEIITWPTTDTGNFTRTLAPFVDFNSDGIYNPYDGDYPDIKGDQMIWWIMNDNFSNHTVTGSPLNLGIEIHASAYAYNCPLLTDIDSVVNYTTFYHYDFINRTANDYHDVQAGIFDDVELGYAYDDYIGCDTSLDIGFVYNGDNNDDEVIQDIVNEPGYGINPPMFNIAILKGPEATAGDGIDNNHNGITDENGETCMMNSFVYYNNDFTAMGNPVSYGEYDTYLHAMWKDSSHVVYGGTGYDNTSHNYTPFVFSGDPYSGTDWSEVHPTPGGAANIPNDRRFISSSGPFDLPAHGKRSLDYAYVFTRDPNSAVGQSTFALNRAQVTRIKHFFETDSFPCKHLVGVDEIGRNEMSATLYPNPATEKITVTINENDYIRKEIYVTGIIGQRVMQSVSTNANTIELDVQNLAKGIYFLHIETTKGSVVKKFVKE